MPDRDGNAILAEPQVRRDLSRGDARHADALRAQLLRERLGEVHERRLRRPVVDHSAVGLEEGVDRDDVDDRGAVLAGH
jgi:hypothetical protein